MRSTKRRKGPEAAIQDQIRQYLKIKGCLPVRVNSGAMSGTHNGKRWFFRFNDQPGASDLLVCCPPDGRFVAIEVKAPGGKLTAAQEQFLNLVRLAGGIGIVAHSLDDVTEVIQ
jgi:hypothetical protein